MAFRELPSADYLRQRLLLDEETGKLYWRPRTPEGFAKSAKTQEHMCKTWNARFAGKEAFTANFSNGYRQGQVDGQTMLAHRVIWKMHTGVNPNIVDHLNGDKSDNRPINLRSGTYADNAMNRPKAVNNSSGCTGVYRCSSTGRWRAELSVAGHVVKIGRFTEFGEAVQARKEAEARFGFHRNHGR